MVIGETKSARQHIVQTYKKQQAASNYRDLATLLQRRGVTAISRHCGDNN